MEREREESKHQTSGCAAFCQHSQEEPQEEIPVHHGKKACVDSLQKKNKEKRKSKDIEEFKRSEDNSEKRHQQSQHEVAEWGQEQENSAKRRNEIELEVLFPQSRINKLIKLDSSVIKVSSDAAKLINIATVFALGEFSSQCENLLGSRKTITKDDVAAMIKRGGKQTSFLLDCLYAITEDHFGCNSNVSAQKPLQDSICGVTSSVKSVMIGNKNGKNLKCVDISSFFRMQ